MEPFAAVRAELQTVSASTEEHPSKLSPTSLDSYDLDTCYNRYLYFYQLPLLKEPQTINSFRQYLIQNNAIHLVHYLLITVNSDKTEAHVYLPSDLDILPNHHIFSMTHDSHDIPLRSKPSLPITPLIPSTLSTSEYYNNNQDEPLNLS